MELDMHGTNLGARNDVQRAAREKAYATPLSEFHPGNPELFRSDTLWPYSSGCAPKSRPFLFDQPGRQYWSVTRYDDIMHVDTHGRFFLRSQTRGIMLRDIEPEYQWPSFIAMDAPRHAPQRKTVSPLFTPPHLAQLAILIRERSAGRG